MRYLNNFEDYNPLNEDKEHRAERKKARAVHLLDEVEDAIQAGDTKKAHHLLKIATKKIVNAEKLDPNINTQDVSDKIISLDNVISPKGEDTDGDKFNTISKKHRDKIKLTDFDIVNKIKILGDNISNDELQGFLKTLKTYLNEYWDDLQKGHNFPEEYQSPYTDFTLNVKRKFGQTKFVYKEGAFDKIKLVFSNKDFFEQGNKQMIEAEINDVLDSEHIKNEIIDNYVPEKDKMVYREPVKTEEQIPAVSVEQNKQIEKVATELIKKDETFINNTVKFLIDEKLNIGFANTDEDKIYNYFVKQNAQKLVVADNITEILIGYKKKKATMNESWDDFVDSTVGATKRATQSIRTQESKGVVGDLMWAFNTDARTLSKDINTSLSKIGSAYQKELNKAIDGFGKINMMKEDIEYSSILTGMLVAGFALKKSPMLARLAGLKGATSAVSGGEGLASSTLAKNAARLGIRSASGGTASTVMRGGLAGVSRMGGLLANPYVWIGLAVIAAVGGSWYLWNSFDEQQDQLATMFLIMWASGSEEFHKELRENGVIVKAPDIDISKLNNLLSSGELFSKEEEVKPEVSENKVLKFSDFNKDIL
jgi:hypothetical protein